MSIWGNHLDWLYREFINGRLPDLLREKEGDLAFGQTFSHVWLKGAARLPGKPGPERTRLLQNVLQGVERLISIIYGSNQYRIQYLTSGQKEQPEKDPRTLILSLEPLNAPPRGYSLYDQVDVVCGGAIHEAGHLREGSRRHPFETEELKVLSHLVEDVIHDRLISLEYPGFEGYLLKYRRYQIEEKLLPAWGQERNSRVNMLILALRSTWPVDLYKQNVKRAYLYTLYVLARHSTVEALRKLDLVELTYQLFQILYDERLFLHHRELNYVSERLVLSQQGLSTEGKGGKERGGEKGISPISEQLFKDMDMLPQPNLDQWKGSGPPIHDWLGKRTEGDFRGKGWSDEYAHHYTGEKGRLKRHGVRLRELEDLERLREEAFEPLQDRDQRFRYDIYRTIPTINEDIRENFHSAYQSIRSQIIQLRNQLAWANTRMKWNQYDLRTGELDEDALYKAKYSRELFMLPLISEMRTPQLDVALMVDGSSSMGERVEGGKIAKSEAARQLATLFVEAFGAVGSVNTWVYQFVQESVTGIALQELYSPKPEGNKERIGAIRPGKRTPEYQALLAVSGLLQREGRPGVQKVFLILSDGQPGDEIIPYAKQKQKIKALVHQLEAQKHVVIQIALGPEAMSMEMYKNSIPFPREGYGMLVKEFGKLLKRLL